MTIASAVPWYVAIGLGIIGALIGAAWGASVRRKDDIRWVQHLVSADAGQRTAIRDIYRAEGYEDPEFYADPEPEPQPAWWRRAVAALRRGPVMDAQPVDEAETETRTQEPEVNEPYAFTPDPNPDTAPIRMPSPTGPETEPAAAVIADEWQARSEQMLAEARAAIAEIGGGR